ncbi:unnamed protein product [Dracunculus medinensis]|uniref:guanylate cyclase n=1 Tax=Dracunculus medinensis TaxID=318479 RepID=A0A158Q3G5_DRAME|nr:unnamed protein product [Dracunculus medinensis]
MFGWIHESFRQLITRKYGRPIWLNILELAKYKEGDECYIQHYYDDEETFRLAGAVATVIGSTVDEVWEAYGGFLIHYTMQTGWDDLLRAMASTLEEFIDGLDSLHYFINNQLYHERLKGPSFRSEQISEGSLLLHYYSRRLGLYPIVKGVVREVARVIYKLEIVMKVVDRRQEKFGNLINDHVIFLVKQEFCGLSLKDFCSVFPFHICFDRHLILEHVGEFKRQFLTEYAIPGQMVMTASKKYVIYLCTLNATTIKELLAEQNLYISGMQLYDRSRDLIMLNQTRLAQVALNKMLEESTYTARHLGIQLAAEKKKTDDLLCELMPYVVVEALRHGKSFEACDFPKVTVLFTDIVSFTNMCAQCTPFDVVMMLNDLYVKFDRIVALHNVYKVETIGDAYVIGGGVPQSAEDDTERVLNAAIGLLMESKTVLNPVTGNAIQIRVGIHTGEVVAGVVGIKMPKYCLFGETVNIANKMESHSLPCRIHVSKFTKKYFFTNKFFEFSDRGKGIMHTFFLECNRSKTVWEIIDRPQGTLSIQLELKGLNLDIRIKKCLSIIVTFCRQYRKSTARPEINDSKLCVIF